MTITTIILFIILAFIAYHDFSNRTISVVLLSAGIVVAAIYSVLTNGLIQTLEFTLINISFVLIQLIGITIFFSIKKKKLINIINSYLGSGDLWFFGVLSLSFSPANFILFNLCSCILILMLYAYAELKLKKRKKIPLAGCMAVLLTIVLGLNYFNVFNSYDDYLWITYLN